MVVVNIRNESVLLSWEESKTTDVSYQIQQRGPEEHFWKDSIKVRRISKTRASVERLEPGEMYQFRILPYKNKVKGTPSKATDFVFTENPFGENFFSFPSYCFTDQNLVDICIFRKTIGTSEPSIC